MPRENSSPQTEAAGSGRAGRRKLRRIGVLLAASGAYLILAFALKPDFGARISGTLDDAREALSSRFRKHPDHPIDLNSASAEELQQLPGIGPVTAGEIVRFRQQSGPIRRPEDLLALPRFTRRSLERIRPYIVVSTRPQ